MRYLLSELGELKNGLNFEKKSVDIPCKIIGVKDFANNTFPNYDMLDSIDSSLVNAESLLENGDIVFVRSNGNKDLVGRSMFIHNIPDKVSYSGFCIRFRPDKNKVVPEYIFYALRSPFCRKQYSYSQQTNITNLSQVVLGNVIVDIPSLKEQRKCVRMLYSIDRKIEYNRKINDNLPYQSSMVA
jgi:type I restriction enzyme S subunit